MGKNGGMLLGAIANYGNEAFFHLSFTSVNNETMTIIFGFLYSYIMYYIDAVNVMTRWLNLSPKGQKVS